MQLGRRLGSRGQPAISWAETSLQLGGRLGPRGQPAISQAETLLVTGGRLGPRGQPAVAKQKPPATGGTFGTTPAEPLSVTASKMSWSITLIHGEGVIQHVSCYNVPAPLIDSFQNQTVIIRFMTLQSWSKP